MKKQEIIDAIRRTAQANGGKALGRESFTKETGIKESDWYGKHWTRWGDALEDAGFAPNQLQRAFDEEYLIGKLIELIRELQPPRFPVQGDLLIKARNTPDFPSHNTFNRLGSKSERAAKVAAHCIAAGGFDDIVALCRTVPHASEPSTSPPADGFMFGYVY